MDQRRTASPADGPGGSSAYFTPRGLAEHLDVKRDWIYRHAWMLPGRVKVGNQVRFRRVAVLAWLARLEDQQTSDASSDGRFVDRAARLVREAGLPDPRAHDLPQDAQIATAAPRRRGRRRQWQIPGQGAPP